MPKRLLLLAFILPVMVKPAPAQERLQYKESFGSLKQEVDKLISVQPEGITRDQRSEFVQLWDTMSDDLAALKNLASQAGDKPNADYLESLNQDRDALKLVTGGNLKIEEKLALCRSVAKDLQVKNAYAVKNPKAEFGLVKLTVRTKNGATEVSNFEVWYAPSAWAADERRHKRFNKNSSPTDRDLPPGGYTMWTRVPGRAKFGTKEPISVGPAGEHEQTVDLPTPSDN